MSLSAIRSPLLRSTLATLLFAVPVMAQQPPATLRIDGAFLVRFKAHPDPSTMSVIRDEADRAMSVGPFSVMHKTQAPPSGDKHDFMSLAPYWWPNPASKNGLPYIRHDGETNPQERTISDHAELGRMEEAVYSLALGYYFTGEERYAARAALLLRTWFLNPTTRMNPNLNYAQAIPGITEGRGIGLIGIRDIPLALDGITLLSGSSSLTAAERAGLRQWFSRYVDWLQHSRNGGDESAAKNNHGSWYDQQLAGIALFLGQRDLARSVVEMAKTKRVALQIQPDGREPLELARTKSFSYSTFNLTALMHLAQEGRMVGVNLWDYRAPDGASIRAALDFLLPYALGEKQWTYESLDGVESSGLVQPLLLGAIAWHEPIYANDASKLAKHPNAQTMLLQQEARLTLGLK
jgi:hypothetical protein